MHKPSYRIKKLSNNNQGSLVIVAAVAILAISITGYFVFKSVNNKATTKSSTTPTAKTPATPSTQPAIEPSVTATWPIYVNPYDGYSIKYPEGWFTQPASRESSTFSISNFDRTTGKPSGEGVPNHSQYVIEVYVDKNPQELTLSNFLFQRDATLKENGVTRSIANQTTRTTVGGVNIIYRESYGTSAVDGQPYNLYEAWVGNKSRVFHSVGRIDPTFKDLFILMVDSIEFTK